MISSRPNGQRRLINVLKENLLKFKANIITFIKQNSVTY